MGEGRRIRVRIRIGCRTMWLEPYLGLDRLLDDEGSPGDVHSRLGRSDVVPDGLDPICNRM